MQVNEYKSTSPPGSPVQKLQWSVPLGHQKLVTKIVLVFNLNATGKKKYIFKIFQLSLEAKGAPRLNFSAAVPAFDIPDICLLQAVYFNTTL